MQLGKRTYFHVMSLRLEISITGKYMVVDHENAKTNQKFGFPGRSDPFKDPA